MIWIIINVVIGAIGLILLSTPKFSKNSKYIILGIALTICGNITAYIKSEIDSISDSKTFNNYRIIQEGKYDSLIQLSNNISIISNEILANSFSPIQYSKMDSLLQEHEYITKADTEIKLLDVRTFIYEHSEQINHSQTTKKGVFLLISVSNKNTPTTINSIRIKGKIYLSALEMEGLFVHYPNDSITINKLWTKHLAYINIDFTAYPDKRTKKYLMPNEKALLLYTIIEPSYGGYSSIKRDQIGFEGIVDPENSKTVIYSNLLFKYPLNGQLPYYRNYPFDVRYKDEFYNNIANIYLDTDKGLLKIDSKKLSFFDRLNKYELENDSFEKMIQYWNK